MPEQQIVASLLALTLEMGHVIRQLDENGDHSELWTQDGEYVADPRFLTAHAAAGVQVPDAVNALLSKALEAMETIDGVDTVVRWKGQYEKIHQAIAALRASGMASPRGLSASAGQALSSIPASSALDSSASGESTSGQVHSGDALGAAPSAGGSAK